VSLETLALEEGSFIPIQPKPSESMEDGFGMLVSRPIPVRILDPENEDPTLSPNE
jgi:hypothetical protein